MWDYIKAGWTDIIGFLTGLYEAVTTFVDWMGDVAQAINDVNVETSGISHVVGLFRYIVGEPLWLVYVTLMYIGIILLAIAIIGKIVSVWKSYSPFHGG